LWKLCAVLGLLFVLSICTWKLLQVYDAPRDAGTIAAFIGAVCLMGAVLGVAVGVVGRIVRPRTSPRSAFWWRLCRVLLLVFVLAICAWKVLEVTGAPQGASTIAAGIGAVALMGAVLSVVVAMIRRVFRPLGSQQS
jgi:hypothetical protein